MPFGWLRRVYSRTPFRNPDGNAEARKPVNVRLLILSILLSTGLICVACGSPSDRAAVKSAASDKRKPVEPKKTIRVNHLAGEVLSVDPGAKTITVRVRNEDVELHFDDSTVVKIDLDVVKPQEIPPGTRATVKYVERKGRYVAKGVFISTETAEKKEPSPQSSLRSSA
jgi:hypothetical protein